MLSVLIFDEEPLENSRPVLVTSMAESYSQPSGQLEYNRSTEDHISESERTGDCKRKLHAKPKTDDMVPVLRFS